MYCRSDGFEYMGGVTRCRQYDNFQVVMLALYEEGHLERIRRMLECSPRAGLAIPLT